MSADLLLFALMLVGTGVLAGVLAGMLGIGGGLVFVPALLFVFHGRGIAMDSTMHLAVGTSLTAIVLTSTSSIAAHARRDNVDWAVFRSMAPGLVVGGIAGAALASLVSGTALRQVFGVFLLLAALQLISGFKPAPQRELPGPVGGAAAGGAIGTLSAMLGIGGGTLTVPFLAWCNMPVLRAVGTSAAAGLPLAAAGAAGFVVSGWRTPGLPATTVGHVDWVAAILLGTIAMLAAPAGVRFAHRVSGPFLRRVFGTVMVVISARLIWT